MDYFRPIAMTDPARKRRDDPGNPEVCADLIDNDCDPESLDIFDGDAHVDLGVEPVGHFAREEFGHRGGIVDDEDDHELPIHAEVIPVRQVLGEPEPCPRLLDGVDRPASLEGYSAGRLLAEVLAEAHERWSAR